MDAILLAAGRATRMSPLCSTTPKPLLPIAGRSLLWRMMDGLASVGVTRIVVVVYHEAAKVRAHARAWRGSASVKCVVQKSPRGTGDAVAAGARTVQGDALVVMGDAIVSVETLKRLASAKGFAVAAARVPDPQRFGSLKVKGVKVLGVAEKSSNPPSDLVNTGLYRVPAEALADCRALKPSPRGELEFTDVVAAWGRKGAVRWVRAQGWMDVGRPWDLLAAQDALMGASLDGLLGKRKSGGPGMIEAGVQVRGRLFAAEGAVVKSRTYVEGDVFVGPGSVVGPNAYLRGPVSLGTSCKVGAGCEVKASVLLDHAHAPHLNYVGDSVLGEGCNLGAGTIVANLKHSGKTILVEHRGEKVDSMRRKLGAIVGDGAKTGINSSLNPGTILGADAWIGSGMTVSGTFADGEKRLTPVSPANPGESAKSAKSAAAIGRAVRTSPRSKQG